MNQRLKNSKFTKQLIDLKKNYYKKINRYLKQA